MTVCYTQVLHCWSACFCVNLCLTGAVRSPTAPTVELLSDTAVMVRWTAVPTPSRGGLNVMFYKVQYRRVGGRRKSHGWETVDEDIASTKHSVRVDRLRPGQWPLSFTLRVSAFIVVSISM